MHSSVRTHRRSNFAAKQPELLRALSRTLVAFTLGMLTALALLLFVRRIAGGFVHAPGGGVLLAGGVVLALLGVLLRAGWRSATAAGSDGRDWWLAGLVTLVLALAALSLTVPQSGAVALLGLWAPLVVAEATAWGVFLKRRRRGFAPRRRPGRPEADEVEESPLRPSSARAGGSLWDEFAAMFAAESLPAGATQQTVRTRTGGVESIACRLRGQFAAEQRTLNLHVAFCPPLVSAPQMQVRQTSGPPSKIDASFAQPYGARLELRLAKTPSEPVEVIVEAVARVEPVDSEGAP